EMPDATRGQEVKLAIDRQRPRVGDLDAAERVRALRIEAFAAGQIAPDLAAGRVEDVEVAAVARDRGGGTQVGDAAHGERHRLRAGREREQVAVAVEDQQPVTGAVPCDAHGR